MKRRILSISILIITLSAFMTLTNCKKKEEPAPCVPPDAPVVKKTITVDAGQTVNLVASVIDNATYKWTGPNGYSSNDTNPNLTSATVDMSGEYKCTITVAGCTSKPASTYVLVRGLVEDTRGDEFGNAMFYKTIKIGTQTWMAENLRWKPTDFSTDWKVYGNDPNTGKVYGALYNYTLSKMAASGMKGWRVPTDQDWQTLINYLGGDTVAGSKLKEEGTTHWLTPNAGSTNTSGFTALGSGYFDVLQSLGFQDITTIAYYWTSTPYTDFLIIYKIRSETFWTYREYGDKSNFYSIRLIKIP